MRTIVVIGNLIVFPLITKVCLKVQPNLSLLNTTVEMVNAETIDLAYPNLNNNLLYFSAEIPQQASPWLNEDQSPWLNEDKSPWLYEDKSPWLNREQSPWLQQQQQQSPWLPQYREENNQSQETQPQIPQPVERNTESE